MTAQQSARLQRLSLWPALLLASLLAPAEEKQTHGQRLYVPVYSEIAFGDKMHRLDLTVTLSIRNSDGKNPITIKRVDYFNSAGTLVRAYLKQPMSLMPMASAEHIIMESDRSGGISASFLVDWESDTAVSAPVIEALMVSSSYNRALAFNSQARVLTEKP